jgi:hypothetical protein
VNISKLPKRFLERCRALKIDDFELRDQKYLFFFKRLRISLFKKRNIGQIVENYRRKTAENNEMWTLLQCIENQTQAKIK